MNNLTTRKIVLGLLMVLVLAFSVQGVADALNFTSPITRSDSTDPHVYTGDPFEIQFSVRLENSQGVNSDTITVGNATDIAYAARTSTRANVSASATITTDATGLGAYSPGDTRYYTVTTTTTDTSIPGVALTLTTNTRNWATEAEAAADTTNRYTVGNATDIAYAARTSTRANVSASATITTDATGLGAYSPGDTHYYTVTTTTTDTSIPGVALALTTNTRNWATEAEAYHYNEEAVSITPTGGISIVSINGHTINGAANALYTLNEDERWGGTTSAELTNGQIRVKCSAGNTPGPGTITLADLTSNDYPTGTSVATAPSVFSITIVSNPLNLDEYPTISAVSEGVITHNVRNQITVTLMGSNSTNAEVGFEVLSGFSGNLYLNREGGRSAKKLLTYTNASSVATVYLLPNSRTNQVRVWVSGQNPASTDRDYARVVTYTYGFADLTADLTLGGPGGNGQRGVVNTRLSSPFVVKVIDGTNRGFPGAVVTFNTVNTDLTDSMTLGKLFPHPDFRAEPVTSGGTQGDAINGYDPLEIKTDRNGEAKVHLKLSGTLGTHTVTATYGTASRTFTATGISGASATYVLTVDTQRSAQTQNVALRTRAAKPLVVRVLEGGVNPVADQPVRFTTGDGTLSPRPEADQLIDNALLNSVPNVPNLPTDRTIKTNASGEAWIDYIAGNSAGPVTIYARAFSHTDGSSFSRIDSANTVIFTVNAGSAPTPPSQPETGTRTITLTLSSTTGEPGDEIDVTVSTSSATPDFVVIDDGDFSASDFDDLSGRTPHETTLTLPDEEGEYDFFAVGPGGVTSNEVTVTVETGTLGEISISQIGSLNNGVQTFSITVRGTDNNLIAGSLSVRVTGPGVNRSVPTANGSGAVDITLPTASGLHTFTASAEGYTSVPTQARGTGTTQQEVADEEEEEETVTVSEPDSISIVGPSQRDGTVNEELGAALVVEVVDDDGEAVEDARVIFRVRSGQGRLSQGGRGRAIAVQTDSRGHARANYTPTGGGTHTVEAEVRGVTRTVEFTITTGSAPPPRDLGTREEPSPTVSPVVHVGAASRPPMLWVDGGAIYALVGASPQRFASSVDNALNIAIGGGKVYWTEKTGESGGTINSANLNGSGVKELASIFATPMGIAVDTAGSKLYWTNSAGRIQSANLDGSRIQNVRENLSGPMDIAFARGILYWTQYDETEGEGSVELMNPAARGSARVRISTGSDVPGSVVIAGNKVYWTEMTGTASGTINSANRNGTNPTELNDIRAVPMGIGVDTARSKLYWTNSRGRIQSADLNGKKIQNVVDGLGAPGDMVLNNSIAAPVDGGTSSSSGSGTTASNKYDVNGDGVVDGKDKVLVLEAVVAGTYVAKYDVNDDKKVTILDYVLVEVNIDGGAAGAPALLGMKLSAIQIDRLQEQIDLLIATGDRSPAAMRTLIYLQQLIVMARPEKTQLLANYPNPFNPETWIPYELATDTNVKVTIYNTQGVVIRSLEFGHQSAGYYTGRDRAAYWDGRNALGEQVASGLYFYQLETDEMSLMRKMVILK